MRVSSRILSKIAKHDGKTIHCSGKGLGLAPELVSREAFRVAKSLHKRGHDSYIVGGGVRDILLGTNPKDFDIVTEITPRKICRIFRNSRPIGRRFKIVHVYEGQSTIEVSTFRQGIGSDQNTLSRNLIVRGGQIIRDNVYGSIEDDIMRRDFTINAIYYNPCSEEVICHHQALQDLCDGRLRLIGDADKRYREDPVRMLRALRFAAKLSFHLEESAQKGIDKHRHLITNIPRARLFNEVSKMFQSGGMAANYELLLSNDFFGLLFPMTNQVLQKKNADRYHQFLFQLFTATDKRIATGLNISPGFIMAGIFVGINTSAHGAYCKTGTEIRGFLTDD